MTKFITWVVAVCSLSFAVGLFRNIPTRTFEEGVIMGRAQAKAEQRLLERQWMAMGICHYSTLACKTKLGGR
jgi:hypothetical protein